MPWVKTAHFQIAASASLIALILLCVAWEGWLSPLRPGGSMLVWKAVPLLAPLRGILHGRVYTYRWSTLLIWLYFAEGAMRAFTETGPTHVLALIEIALALFFFTCAALFVRRNISRSG
jgi:uncharacterized membrane protein